jgi:hypothetical protein
MNLDRPPPQDVVMWATLERALRFIENAERHATPVRAAIAFGAAIASVSLALFVWAGYWLIAAPLTIVAASLATGALLTSRARRED